RSAVLEDFATLKGCLNGECRLTLPSMDAKIERAEIDSKLIERLTRDLQYRVDTDHSCRVMQRRDRSLLLCLREPRVPSKVQEALNNTHTIAQRHKYRSRSHDSIANADNLFLARKIRVRE